MSQSDKESSEIEIAPPINISTEELKCAYKKHKIFSLIHKREGIYGSSTEESVAEDSAHENARKDVHDQNKSIRRSLRNKHRLSRIQYDEKSDGDDFSPSTESYSPSSECDTDKENFTRNKETIEESTPFKEIYLNIRSKSRLSLDSSTLRALDINRSVVSYDSDIFNNITDNENNLTENTTNITNNQILDINIPEENTKEQKNKKDSVLVAKTSNIGMIRKWDKKQACIFCSKLISKLPRHLESKHSKEPEVIKLSSLLLKSEERKMLIEDLKKKVAASEMLRNNVLSRMNIDEVSLIVKQDDLILKLGSKLMTKHDQDQHLSGYISQKMRELARFLIEIRKICPAIQNLTECINPIYFPKVIEAVKAVTSYNSKTGKYGIPSLALKIGHSLKKCANIIITESLIQNLTLKREMAQNFIKLCENEWSTNISTGALTTLYRNKWNMPDRLPLAEDVKLLNKYLCEERDKYITFLKNAEVTILNWTSLAKIVLAQTLLFNRRRAGEVEKIPVKSYLTKMNPKDVDKSMLSEFEIAISQAFIRFEVRGKKGRKVPVILYPKLIEAYDILLLYRYHVGIPKENDYFFALPPLSHFRGSDVMRKFAILSGAKHPESLTSTKLKKTLQLCLKY
ncbi:hypothetical protein ACJJTC_016249 [Scirpophaga incertulas]